MIHTIAHRLLGYYSQYHIQKQQDKQYQQQQHIYNSIIHKLFNTEFGKSHQLQHNTDYHDFKEKVPIQTYETYKPWIESAKTQKNIIRPGKIKKFTASSGTTSAKKHIPLTQEAINSTNKAGKEMLAMLLSTHKVPLYQIQSRPLGGSIQQTLDDGTTIGDVSAQIIQTTPSLYKNYSFDEDTLLNPNRQEKREIYKDHLDTKQKTIILGVTSWIAEMLQYIQQQKPEAFGRFKNNIEAIVRGGVSIKPFIKQFQQWGIQKHIGVYNASEGFFGYQNIRDFDNTQGDAPYILASNHGIVYEFAAINDQNFDTNNNINPNAQTYRLHEISQEHIDKKQKFALIITSNAGLCRYMIGDVIRFVDTKGHFIIQGRTKQSLNLKGEELMIDHTETAIAQANQQHNTSVSYYSVGPDTDDNPCKHQRVVEGVDQNNAEVWMQSVDSTLQELNADYKAKRTNDILLKPPSIHCVNTGTFRQWLENHNKLGGQYKTIKLASDTKTIEELLAIHQQKNKQ